MPATEYIVIDETHAMTRTTTAPAEWLARFDQPVTPVRMAFSTWFVRLNYWRNIALPIWQCAALALALGLWRQLHVAVRFSATSPRGAAP